MSSNWQQESTPAEYNGIQIPVVSEYAKGYPIALTDRWGNWLKVEPGLREFSAKAMAIQARYGNGVEDEQGNYLHWQEGDPRQLMSGAYESTFVAECDGKIGILSEVELELVKGDPGQKSVVEGGSLVVAAESFANAVRHWQHKLVGLQEAFPMSNLMVAYGRPIYDHRLALCAFTPLLGQDEIFFASPYEPYETRSEAALDKTLNELAYQATPGVEVDIDEESRSSSRRHG